MNTLWTCLQGIEYRQRFYNVNGVRTRAIEAGHGEPLILLHGTGGHAEAYIRNIEEHAKHFHVYVLDMVGHGYTDAPDIDYLMQDYVDFIRDFVGCIGADRIFISGESLGASVAAWFAIQHPQRVQKIVLNTGTLLPPDEAGAKDLRELLLRTQQATDNLDRDTVRHRMRWLMHNEKDITDEIVESRYQIYQQPGRAAVIRKIVSESLGALLDPAKQREWYHEDLLRQIECETLVLWTRYNPGQGVELAEKTVQLIPNARMLVLENSAHWPQWEEADAFNSLHLEYLLQ